MIEASTTPKALVVARNGGNMLFATCPFWCPIFSDSMGYSPQLALERPSEESLVQKTLAWIESGLDRQPYSGDCWDITSASLCDRQPHLLPRHRAAVHVIQRIELMRLECGQRLLRLLGAQWSRYILPLGSAAICFSKSRAQRLMFVAPAVWPALNSFGVRLSRRMTYFPSTAPTAFCRSARRVGNGRIATTT